MKHNIGYWGNVNKRIEYFLNDKGELHNENGPAYISYYENGNKKYEAYYINGKCHNENGPAVIMYYENGNKKQESYYINGERHNTKGAAFVGFYKSGKKNYKYIRYYINDQIADVKNDKQFKKYLKLLSIQ